MTGKRILLGITGGIAAYKIAYLIRILKSKGADVKCVMTPASSDFISPLVVSTLSENPVAIEFWNKDSGEWNNHVELALWADLFLIAPATANTISKMASGACDNLLLATYFSLKCKTIIAPAMDLDMYQHPTLLRNLHQLIADGVQVIPATSGKLASGLEGQGRMEEPERIADYLNEAIYSNIISERKLLITAGPTYEKIDPVRYIGNFSSGKMGFELAEKALLMGYQVTLISGPVNLELVHPLLKRIDVLSARDLMDCVEENWSSQDVGIFAAAVADYRPIEMASQKIKKKSADFELKLIRNPDVLEWAAKNKKKGQYVMGFALETNNSSEYALSKLNDKNLDAIVMNSMENEGTTFQSDWNKITILNRDGTREYFDKKPKSQVALDILNFIEKVC
ncbi:MAG: bifunctional phosphopantothenoylcysteine decarboxylase/phosphopantothenate--cysteine ligase CoaBC [Bacteroidetes bacterium]|nr:bifunctional phosphopantothenoylcysteine decarboxylase/phosphopantothenate--cysteine ligase CoaBC [Bacteroidota bacterium]